MYKVMLPAAPWRLPDSAPYLPALGLESSPASRLSQVQGAALPSVESQGRAFMVFRSSCKDEKFSQGKYQIQPFPLQKMEVIA